MPSVCRWSLLFAFAICLYAAPTVRGEDPPETPLPVVAERAYPNLQLRRPATLTHAGDGSGRIFAAELFGKVLVLPRDTASNQTTVFINLEDRVQHADKENEEGLLGLAFHPKFRENGQFFVYYTRKGRENRTSLVSRFRVKKDDPTQGDPDSEEVLLRIPQPFWNHNGGTIAFGPDSMLYIALGDGGNAYDPQNNGQNLNTWLGSILRINVDHHDQGERYAVPPDNPFVGRVDARPEIWAYGFRNVWRMSFDRSTGTLWAADVGQDFWEEVNLVRRGGNYGWKVREAKHRLISQKEAEQNPNGADTPTPPDMIDPIWEYHHSVGKSITGGHVYRGRKVPALAGMYVCGDYITGRLWALKYDEGQRQLAAVHTLGKGKVPVEGNLPIITFGEDESGETLFADYFGYLYEFRPQ